MRHVYNSTKKSHYIKCLRGQQIFEANYLRVNITNCTFNGKRNRHVVFRIGLDLILYFKHVYILPVKKSFKTQSKKKGYLTNGDLVVDHRIVVVEHLQPIIYNMH